MIREKFEESRKKLLDECDEITQSKGQDYTKGQEDCLANFYEGTTLGIEPLQVCAMFMKKHSDAIANYIRTGGQSESEPIRERIKDNINYLLFLNALIEDDASRKRG